MARERHWQRFRDWLAAMIDHGVSPNVGSFLGGGTLRQYARGMAMGPSSPDELATMRKVTEEAMRDGAFGVSCALIYPPDTYATTDEIVEVCTVVGRHGGLYITHLRSEADHLLEGVEEALGIGRRANVPVEIYHLKAAGRANWHKMPDVIAHIDAARAAGLDVMCDMYPYVAGGTGLAATLPVLAAWFIRTDPRYSDARHARTALTSEKTSGRTTEPAPRGSVMQPQPCMRLHAGVIARSRRVAHCRRPNQGRVPMSLLSSL